MDIHYIKNLVQDVLDRTFKQVEKRRIVEYHQRLNFACPVCSDSSKNVNAKRCNLYTNRLQIICFNCGFQSGFEFFVRRFDIRIDPSKKLEISEYLSSQIQVLDYQNEADEFEFNSLIDLKTLEEVFKDGDFSISNFMPIQDGGIVHNYLKDRGIQGKMTENIYQAKYWYSESRYENIICFLNKKGNKVLSMQIRNLKLGKKRMFKIYNFESLYKFAYSKDEVDDIETTQLVMLNKLSYYFNIFNVDFYQPITVFEGFLDSLFFPNSIGIIGVNTSLEFLEKNSGLELRYFFDNDKAGNMKTDEKIKNGFPCFLWNKLFDYVVSKKQNVDPYKFLHRISKIKDLNELNILVPNAFKKMALDNFFSKDEFDLKWVPKERYSYKSYK